MINLTEYTPSFETESSSPVNEDAQTYLDRITSEPAGACGVTFSEKSGNSAAKSLAHAGKMVASSLVQSVNKRNKEEAFAERFPKDADLIKYDAEVAERFKAFSDYPKTNEEIEICNLLNSEKMIPVDVRTRVAKHVAAIGGYNALLTQDIEIKFATYAMNFWISKNPVLRKRIELSLDGGK